jgi:CMP-N,N'-diacetyllegionaminic acid synthase
MSTCCVCTRSCASSWTRSEAACTAEDVLVHDVGFDHAATLAAARLPSGTMSVLAVIPARGGSKGIPQKNLVPLAGRPLLAHTIAHALAASCVDRVVVSTDDEEIAAVARTHGADVVRRPGELSGDRASSESALLHVLEQLHAAEGYRPELLVFLQCTAPIRSAGDIDGAVRTLRDTHADSVLSVVPAKPWLWRVVDGVPESVDYDYRRRPRRQERPPEFFENGSIYVFKPWVLRDLANRLGGKIALYEMDYWSRFDIDDADDLKLCEWILAQAATS